MRDIMSYGPSGHSVFFLTIGAIAALICWNCRISTPTLVLSVVLGLAIGVMRMRTESFEETTDATDATISNDLLLQAGIIRPSVFNCTSEIGKTAEQNALYASSSDM